MDDFNWAVTGTGGIIPTFLTGLREAGGTAAAVVSRSESRARDFVAKNGIPAAFGDFDEMLRRPEIHAVYVGSPHQTHCRLTVKALRAGKAVLCEKPFAVNAAQAGEMIAAAREGGVFLMEAMWTRFLPAIRKVRAWLAAGRIGTPGTVHAGFGIRARFDPESRLFKAELGGGSLLDLGVYPLAFASMVFGGEKPAGIVARLFLGETGVDEEAAAVLVYGGGRTAVVSSSLRTAFANEAWIYGSSGRIHVPSFFNATAATLFGDDGLTEEYRQSDAASGFSFEIAEFMRLVRAGRTESPEMPLAETLLVAETMDRIREQGGLRYPFE